MNVLIVLAYNEELYLETTILSIIDNFDKVLVIDDKSTDKTPLIIESLKSQYDKISVIQNNKNYGPGKSLNIGIKESLKFNPEYIVKIDGDNFTLEDEKGEPSITKTGAEIMGKVEGEGGEATEEYKVGDSVIHLKKDKKKEEWDALSDEEKKDPNGEKAKEIVGVHKIEKIEGDNFTFKDNEGNDFTKTKDEILGKTEAPKVEGQEDLVKKLGDMKSSKPEDIKKVASYVDFISKDENKAKVEEIEKIIGNTEE